MSELHEIRTLVRDGREILRTRRPNERQRKWREWREQVQTVSDALGIAEKPRLQLAYQTIREDIAALDLWLVNYGDVVSPGPQPQVSPSGSVEDEPNVSNSGAEQNDDAIDLGAVASQPRQPTQVFLSYRSADERIAQVIKNELESFDDRIEVFAAYDDLRRGGRWKQQLLEALKASSWFIMVYTDAKMDWQWPIYEATTFEALHAGSEDGDKRLCCLHDTDDRPRPLGDYQSNKVTLFERNPKDEEDVIELKKERFYKESSLFRFLRDFIQYPVDAPLTNDIRRYEPRLVDAAHTIAEAFVKNRQDSVADSAFYPAHIEVTFRPDPNDVHHASIASGSVCLGPMAQTILRLTRSDLSWKDFSNRLKTKSLGQSLVWLEQLEQAMRLATDGIMPDPVIATFYSTTNRRFYRPLLTRQEYYRSGKRKFYVLLVEQLPVDLSQHEEQGILLAALILGSRFRFDFIDRRVEQLHEGLGAENFCTLCANIKSQIIAIESEAAQHGLLDRDSLIQCFARVDQETVKSWYDEWDGIRQELFEAIEDENAAVAQQAAVTEKLLSLLEGKLRVMNTGFMRLGAQRYHELVQGVFTL